MNTSDVCALLDEMYLRHNVGPAGVRVTGIQVIRAQRFKSEVPDGRIECGSGIAGRGHHWSLVTDIPTGKRGPFVATKRELRRQIVEWLAGPPPVMTESQAERYGLYAKLHHNRFGDHYVWVVRRTRAGKA